MTVPTGNRSVVAVAASAGGLEPLRTLVSGLPRDFPAAVLAVMHIPASGASALPAILGRGAAVAVEPARHGVEPVAGTVYVAPPDHHLLLGTDGIILSHGPRENGHRPAADPLFRSVALARGPESVGVVLSGALDDGTVGLAVLRTRGGVGVVQDPDEALHPSMPRSAVERAGADYISSAAGLAPLLVDLCSEVVPLPREPVPSTLEAEDRMERFDPETFHDGERPGVPAGLSCPDCNGTLYDLTADGPVHFRCRVGHAWSPESLLEQQAVAFEGALWVALRTLEDKAALSDRLADQAEIGGRDLTARSFRSAASETRTAAETIRSFIARVSREPQQAG